MRSADNDEGEVYAGGGLKGPLYWLAGVATAVAAKAVSGPGGILGGVLGGNPPPPPPPGMEPVTQKVLDLTTENQELKSRLYANELNTRQVAWNAVQEGKIACLEKAVDRLYGMTQLTIPNGNLNPGVGPVQVVPVPPPVPDVAALAAAIAAAMSATKTAQQGQQG
jgi:hypothetical protein